MSCSKYVTGSPCEIRRRTSRLLLANMCNFEAEWIIQGQMITLIPKFVIEI
jgi:hypothetical protein